MDQYAVSAVETHLFFARTMKEHALFLEAGFPGSEKEWIKTAGWYQEHFEELLREVWEISEGLVQEPVLESRELVTDFTVLAEQRTQALSGIAIDSRITELEKKIKRGCREEADRDTLRRIRELNEKAVWLLNGLIDFKQGVLDRVSKGKLFSANYPLMVEHLLEEAKRYRSSALMLSKQQKPCADALTGGEMFWNRIMMEHALFIRGMLDPGEKKLIRTAEGFAEDYRELLSSTRLQEDRMSPNLIRRSLEETKRLSAFQSDGVEGILECRISSVILPLLADHVLREANHYIRILEAACKER